MYRVLSALASIEEELASGNLTLTKLVENAGEQLTRFVAQKPSFVGKKEHKFSPMHAINKKALGIPFAQCISCIRKAIDYDVSQHE
jgi:hypothetical protein